MNSEDDQRSEPGSPDGVTEDQGKLSDRNMAREEELDQELSEETNYRDTMRGVKSFMGWHQLLEFDTSSFLDDNPFAGSRTQLASKVSVSCQACTAFCPFILAHLSRYTEKMRKICLGPEYDVQLGCWT